MTNVSLKISTRECIPDNQFLGYEGENEVNKLIFNFEDGFFDGSALLNVHRGEQKGYVTLKKVGETYELSVENSLLSQKGDVRFQLSITSIAGKVIKFDPFIMTVKDAIDTDAEMPEEYPSWIDEANAKIAEMDKAIEDAEKLSAKVEQTENGALITITDKEGTTSVEVLNGSGGSGEGGTANYSELVNKPKINNVELIGNKTLNELGIQPKGNYLTSETDPTVPSWAKESAKPNYTKYEINLGNVDNIRQYSTENPPPYPVTSVNNQTGNVKIEIPTKTSELTNDSGFVTETYVDEEIAKFDFIKVVDTLPTTGLPNRIYFVPKSDTQTQDLFDEYAWVNDAWEYITTKQMEIDMADFAKKDEIPDISTKQDTLVSGENIKTINGESILGAGNIIVEGGAGGGTPQRTVLWEGTMTTIKTNVTLAQSMEDFDYLIISAYYKDGDLIRYYPHAIFDVDDVVKSYGKNIKFLGGIALYTNTSNFANSSQLFYQFDSAKVMSVYANSSTPSLSQFTMAKVVGIKF